MIVAGGEEAWCLRACGGAGGRWRDRSSACVSGRARCERGWPAREVAKRALAVVAVRYLDRLAS